MSYFDDASLVMIPSGYKTSKVYSVKPTDGTGDLTFTRSNDTATRVGPDGLIEKVRTNLNTYSQNFTSAGGWGGDPVTATANYGTAPDGTQTSTRLVFGSANQVWQKSVSGLNGNLGVFSLYIKGTAGQTISINDGFVDKVITLTSGWTRVSSNGNVASSSNININTYSSVSARDFEVWGGQVELGDIATSYIATTTAAVSVGPVANVPRLDYLNSSCPRLLLEPQRTNLITFSESFNNAAWQKFSATVTANTSVSPDGTQNADTLVIAAGGYLYREIPGYSVVSGQSATYSVFAKNQTANFLIFGGATPAGTDVYKIENYGNGWYRHSVVRTFTTTTTGTLQYLIAYEIVGTHIIWGAQIEGSNSSYATSYIPTLGAAVTRGADAASKTGISSLIGQTEGTLFVDFNWQQKDGVFFVNSISDGTTDNEIMMAFGSTDNNRLRFSIANGGSASVSFDSTALASGRYKVAFAYANNDAVAYINGVQQFTDSSVTIPATSAFKFLRANDTLGFVGSINQQLLFKTRLSNSELASLTA